MTTKLIIDSKKRDFNGKLPQSKGEIDSENSDMSTWLTIGGEWKNFSNNSVLQDNSKCDACRIYTNVKSDSYILRFKVKLIEGGAIYRYLPNAISKKGGEAKIIFNRADESEDYRIDFLNKTTEKTCRLWLHGNESLYPVNLSINKWLDVVFELRTLRFDGKKKVLISLWVNDFLIFEDKNINDDFNGCVGLGTYRAKVEFKDINFESLPILKDLKELFKFLRDDRLQELDSKVKKIKEKCCASPKQADCSACMNKKKGLCWMRILAKVLNVPPGFHGSLEVADTIIYTLNKGIYFVIKAKDIKKQLGEGDVLYRQCTKLFNQDYALIFYLNPNYTDPNIIENIKKIEQSSIHKPKFVVIPNNYLNQIYSKYMEKYDRKRSLSKPSIK